MKTFERIEHRKGDARDIANMTGISISTVNSILSGRRNPNTPSGERVLKALAMLVKVRNTKVD